MIQNFLQDGVNGRPDLQFFIRLPFFLCVDVRAGGVALVLGSASLGSVQHKDTRYLDEYTLVIW